jgi:beta-lactamase class C
MLARGVLMMALLTSPALASGRDGDRQVRHVVAQEIRAIMPDNGAGGAVVAVLSDGRTRFFSFGWADRAAHRRITPDSLFNLASVRKVFETTLLAQAVRRGELKLNDPVTDYVGELAGSDMGRATLGQLATHTSGLLLPQDHPPWPEEHYTFAGFIRALRDWKADARQAPGKQHIYTHAGFVLLQLALERRFAMSIDELMARRLLRPLGLHSTLLPMRGADGRAELSAPLMRRAVQGYGELGAPIGQPGDQQGYYDFPGTGQMFSSARDLAVFAAANLGDLAIAPTLRQGMRLAQRPVFRISPRNRQALAWEINDNYRPAIVEKNGGLNNSSTYIGMMPRAGLGIVILSNRGDQNPAEVGRRILFKLAQSRAAGRRHVAL